MTSRRMTIVKMCPILLPPCTLVIRMTVRANAINTIRPSATPLLDFYANYDKELKDHHINVMGGYGWQRFWYKNNSVTTDTEGKELATPQHAEAELYLLSFYGRKLLLETTLYVDGYSACRMLLHVFSR